MWFKKKKEFQGVRPCPVCGNIVFAEEQNTYDICEFCGWEDEAVEDADENEGEYESGPNYGSLNENKKWYAQLLAMKPDYKWEKDHKLAHKLWEERVK